MVILKSYVASGWSLISVFANVGAVITIWKISHITAPRYPFKWDMGCYVVHLYTYDIDMAGHSMGISPLCSTATALCDYDFATSCNSQVEGFCISGFREKSNNSLTRKHIISLHIRHFFTQSLRIQNWVLRYCNTLWFQNHRHFPDRRTVINGPFFGIHLYSGTDIDVCLFGRITANSDSFSS